MMKPLLRRIALHGGLAALILGVIGVAFAELASVWLATARTTERGAVETPDADGATAATLRRRVPLFMAVWGFGFVAVGELGLHLWRGRKAKPATKDTPAAEPIAEPKP